MNKKNNLNFKIENEGGILGGLIPKFAFIIFLIIQAIIIFLILIPTLIFSNFLISLFMAGSFSLLNIICAIKWSFLDVSLYQTLKNLIKFKIDLQVMNSKNLVKNNLKYSNENTFIFQYENKLIFKSYFEISINSTNQNNVENLIYDWINILEENNVRIFSINSPFQVKENIDKFTKLINKEIDFNLDKEKILKDAKNKLILQQLADFTILDESKEENNINIIEFNREIIIQDKNLKEAIASSLSNFKIEENAFRSNLKTINIKDLNQTYLNSIKNQILSFNSNQLKFKAKYIDSKNQNQKEYFKFLKVDQLNPLLDPFYLFDLFNNKWNYEVGITFNTLTDKDEDKVFDFIEKSINSKVLSKIKKTNRWKRTSTIKKEQTAQILDEMLQEIEISEIKSKALSILVKIKASSIKELNKKSKEFKAYFKRQRIKFIDLWFLQKDALVDFHIGSENRLNRKGKERKQWFIKRKFNNINWSSIWLTAESCAYSLPIKPSIDIEPTGWIFGQDESNNPVAVDFDIDRPNHHIAIFGKSGSGKTTATEYLLNQKLIEKNNKKAVVFIIDPKGEYENIVDFYNGQKIDLTNGFVNPFKRADIEDVLENRDFVEQFLYHLFLPLKKIETNAVVSVILKLIFNSNEWKENCFTFDILWSKIKKSKQLQLKWNKQHDIICDFLEQYTLKGIKKHLFNIDIPIDFNKKIISFNFQKLIGDVFNNETYVLIFSVLNFMNNLIKQNDPKFKENQKWDITILVDEFHLLVNSNNNLIIKQFDTLYAIARSFGVGIITITQNLSTLNNPSISHHAKSIFSNTAYLISFSQSKNEFKQWLELIPENIEINDYEREEILSNTKHQSLVFYGSNKKFLKWKLGLFYDAKRDENSDGLKKIREAEYNFLFKTLNEYLDIKKRIN